jgi:hypothetical protein
MDFKFKIDSNPGVFRNARKLMRPGWRKLFVKLELPKNFPVKWKQFFSGTNSS